MARLIDADALLEKVQFRMAIDNKNAEIIAGCVGITRRLIENAPTVDAVEVVHGRTEVIEPFEVTLTTRCCLCGVAMGNLDNYCPNCGAKMNGERKDNDCC